MREYTVTLNGVQTTVQLDDESVKNYPDAKLVQTKQAKAPANKAAATKSTK